jgi:8-oxo-dGTP pyrophosphatase MutT (NUDIX family)
LAELRTSLLPSLQAKAAAEGRHFSDDPAVDLVSARVIDDGGGVPGQPTVYRLGWAPTSYYRFALTSNRLDDPLDGLLQNPRGATLREHWGHRLLDVEGVSALPAPVKIGVSTVVVGAKGELLLGERARQFQVGSSLSADDKAPVHVVAEGMTPSDEVGGGEVDPRQTAVRALREELGIERPPAGEIELVVTGFFLDTSRWHAVFTVLAQFSTMAYEDLIAHSVQAPHRLEHRRWLCTEAASTSSDLQQLLRGTHPTMELASNHAAAALVGALAYLDGLPRLASQLR